MMATSGRSLCGRSEASIALVSAAGTGGATAATDVAGKVYSKLTKPKVSRQKRTTPPQIILGGDIVAFIETQALRILVLQLGVWISVRIAGRNDKKALISANASCRNCRL